MTRPSILPDNAVIRQNGKLIAPSFKIAQAFNAHHDEVLRKIGKICCSEEFKARNFEAVDNSELPKHRVKSINISKDGFMLLAACFPEEECSHIKEAYINAFNQLADANPNRRLEETDNLLPHHFDSGWIPARCQRAVTHIRSAWVHHVKVRVQPHACKDKFCGHVVLVIGGEGKSKPDYSTESGVFRGQGFYLEYRMLDELWENIRNLLHRLNATSPY